MKSKMHFNSWLRDYGPQTITEARSLAHVIDKPGAADGFYQSSTEGCRLQIRCHGQTELVLATDKAKKTFAWLVSLQTNREFWKDKAQRPRAAPATLEQFFS